MLAAPVLAVGTLIGPAFTSDSSIAILNSVTAKVMREDNFPRRTGSTTPSKGLEGGGS